MPLATDESQGAFFQEAINPSYLSSMTYDNGADISYSGFPEGLQLLNNSDLNNTLFTDGGPTGFTPPFTPNGPNPFFNSSSLQTQSYFGPFDGHQNSYFPLTIVSPQCTTNMPVIDCNYASQAVEDEQSISTPPTTAETGKDSRSKQAKEASAAIVADVTPPVRKRRARKNKKQLSEEEIRAKRERFLERNRIAASKCRDKKKDWTNNMEEKMRILQADRSLLKELAQTLMEEKRTLTALLHKHSSCNHKGLDAWLKEKANAILSSPDVITSHLSRLDSSQSSRTPRPKPRSYSVENSLGYDGSRSNSLDSKQTNVMSPIALPMSRESSLEFSHELERQHSADSIHFTHGMYRQQSGGSHEHRSYHQDSGISDMEMPMKQSTAEGASSLDIPESMYVSRSSGSIMMANQRMVGQSGYGKSPYGYQTPQFTQG